RARVCNQTLVERANFIKELRSAGTVEELVVPLLGEPHLATNTPGVIDEMIAGGVGRAPKADHRRLDSRIIRKQWNAVRRSHGDPDIAHWKSLKIFVFQQGVEGG